ncbi:MAG: 1-acyl-sn-glycerol-3-phosphate acyltransferase, partial [Candidatus Omnitrophica bacterium]|nr:1-acyl-sn-glycerol-3-phosphate acyltransferase [Candidatus Omnitrophota bacterium]
IFHISPRRVRSVVAKRVMNIWWLGWVLKGTGCVPTNGSSKSTLAVLDNEEEVLIFPEGRCEIKPGNMLPAHTGVAVFALKTGAPVVPVYVKGTFEAWPIGNIFPRFFKRLEARFGPAILFEKVNMEVIPRDTLSQATDKIMEEIKKLNA